MHVLQWEWTAAVPAVHVTAVSLEPKLFLGSLVSSQPHCVATKCMKLAYTFGARLQTWILKTSLPVRAKMFRGETKTSHGLLEENAVLYPVLSKRGFGGDCEALPASQKQSSHNPVFRWVGTRESFSAITVVLSNNKNAVVTRLSQSLNHSRQKWHPRKRCVTNCRNSLSCEAFLDVCCTDC